MRNFEHCIAIEFIDSSSYMYVCKNVSKTTGEETFYWNLFHEYIYIYIHSKCYKCWVVNQQFKGLGMSPKSQFEK